MKIIYFFVRRHVYSYDDKMFQFDQFTNYGYEIEIWSAVRWTFPEIDDPSRIACSNNIHYIDNEDVLRIQLDRIKNEEAFFLVYPYHAYGKIPYIIRKNIRKYGFEYANIVESPALCEKEGVNYSDKSNIYLMIYSIFHFCINIIKSSLKFKVHDLFNDVYRFVGPLMYPSKYNFITVNGQYSKFPNMIEAKNKKNILVHSESYDEYIDACKKCNGISYKYAVHIDGFETGHSDFKKLGLSYPITDKVKHFENLDYLFRKIETQYQCKMIIAAHPKAEYQGNEFYGRKITYGRTNELILNACIVTIGISTCMNIVLLSGKNYLNIYSDEYFYNVPHMQEQYWEIKQKLKCKQLNINDRTQVDCFYDYINSVTNENKKLVNDIIIDENGEKEKLFYEKVRLVLEQVKD